MSTMTHDAAPDERFTAEPTHDNLSRLRAQMYAAEGEIFEGLDRIREQRSAELVTAVHVAFQRLVGMADAYLIASGATPERGLALIDSTVAGVDLGAAADALNLITV